MRQTIYGNSLSYSTIICSRISNRPCSGWTTACCLLGFVASDCFLRRAVVLFSKSGSCPVIDFSPANWLNSMALLSSSLCFSLSSCTTTTKTKKHNKRDQVQQLNIDWAEKGGQRYSLSNLIFPCMHAWRCQFIKRDSRWWFVSLP